MLTPLPRSLRVGARAALVLLAGLVLLVAGFATHTFGGFTAGIGNAGNTAGSGSMQYTVNYTGSACSATAASPTPSCAGSLLPATSTGTGTGSATMSATGTVPASTVTEKVAVTSCAPLDAANVRSAADPMLPHYGVSFSGTAGPFAGSSAMTFDGTTGYATDVLSSSNPQPPSGTSHASYYGVGVWFRTTTNSGGPLFGFSSSAYNGSGTSDRILYLTAAGKLDFGYDTAGDSLTAQTATKYNDGVWHFAYVAMAGTTSTGPANITVYVDGATVVASSAVSPSPAYSGHWHLGWSQIRPGVSSYFSGALSNFTVINSTSAPADGTALYPATSQADFTSKAAAAGATLQWPLADSGNTTYQATAYPGLASGKTPCSYVNIGWQLGNPTACAASPASTSAGCTSTSALDALVAAGPQTVAAADPNAGNQTSTITLAPGSGYPNVPSVAGLQIQAPLSITMTVGTSSWSDTLTWTAGSVFVL
jgi:hypothetical protein